MPNAANPDRVIRLTTTITKTTGIIALNWGFRAVKNCRRNIGITKGHNIVTMTKITKDRKLSSTDKLIRLKNFNQLLKK